MNTKEETYNGWTNYETWAVKLWMDNDYEFYQHWQRQADYTEDIYELSQEIKEYFEDNNPLSDKATVYADLLNGALSEVNWREIAEALKDEVK